MSDSKKNNVCKHSPKLTSITIVTDEPHKPRIEEIGFPRLVFVCDVVCEKCGISGSFPSGVDLIDINW